MLENDALQSQMMSTERDTIDVITYLKKQDHEKDMQLERSQNQIREMKKEMRQEKQNIIEDFRQVWIFFLLIIICASYFKQS